MEKKKVLFITWDGPQTSYMEGLFLPIFHAVQKIQPQFQFHVLQFTWAEKDKLEQITHAANQLDIHYSSVPVYRKPHPAIGTLMTLRRGAKIIGEYAKKHAIDALMPRSTFPVEMTLNANLDLPLIFDADGLPIEERVDFANLQRSAFMYKKLKKIEKRGIEKADVVLTRSQGSIDYHLEHYQQNRNQFFVVKNGRDANQFNIQTTSRNDIRKSLNVGNDDTLFLYAGSFGPQYGWNEMLQIFSVFYHKNAGAKFLLLTGSPEKVEPLVPQNLQDNIFVKKVPFDQVPTYLNAADIAFALRDPKPSMKGVAPIKLGEYLLCGIPTIASMGIGDSESILRQIPHTFLFDHQSNTTYDELVQQLPSQPISLDERHKIREAAISFFSLESSAKSYVEAFKPIFH